MNLNDIDDETLVKWKLEALQELVDEEANRRERDFDRNEFGISGFETDSAFKIEQDITEIVEDVKRERDMREDGLIKPEKGTRKFATIPVTHIIEYFNLTGVDIMGEHAHDKWEMAKFTNWIRDHHPYLMVRDGKKTKYHTMK